MENVFNYYEQLEALSKQGVPVDWRTAAATMIAMLKALPVDTTVE